MDEAIMERMAKIQAIIDGAEDSPTKAKILAALGNCIYLLTGEREKPIIRESGKTQIIRTDKRGCAPCKEKMIQAMKKSAGEE